MDPKISFISLKSQTSFLKMYALSITSRKKFLFRLLSYFHKFFNYYFLSLFFFKLCLDYIASSMIILRVHHTELNKLLFIQSPPCIHLQIILNFVKMYVLFQFVCLAISLIHSHSSSTSILISLQIFLTKSLVIF